MFGADGRLFASCDASGVVAAIDVAARHVVGAIEVGSTGPHMIAMLPDGSKLYSENEEDPFVSVMSPASLQCVATIDTPGGSAGIVASSDGRRVLVVHASEPSLTVIDVPSDAVVERIALRGHQKAAQRVRCSPDGQYVVVTATEEPLVTVLSGDLGQQTTLEVAASPMGVAFGADGRTLLVGNQGGADHGGGPGGGAGGARVRVRGGVETLAFY